MQECIQLSQTNQIPHCWQLSSLMVKLINTLNQDQIT